MAVASIAKVLIRLLQKHGVSRGVKIAQQLGFKNQDIKKAFLNINAEQKKLGLKQFKRKPKVDFFTRKTFREIDRAFGDKPFKNRRPTPRFLEEDVPDYRTLPRKFREPQDIEI
tara:strand:+ start:240 stop:581 length:342 start_codon:yes stop_codon:yes gene_type:complete